MPSAAFLFYGVLLAWTVLLSASAFSLRGKTPEGLTVDQLTDRASWIGGGVLLALLPLLWKWPIRSYAGAVLVPVVGLLITAALARLVMGEFLAARSTGTFVRRMIILAVLVLVVFLVVRALVG